MAVLANQACPAWLARPGARPCLSFDGKVDGFGAELMQIAFAMSYTVACGALFCGVGWWATELTHGVHVPILTQRLFGPNCSRFVLQPLSVQPSCNITCPASPVFCHVSGLPQLLFGSAFLTPSFVTELRWLLMPQLLPLAEVTCKRSFSVAMHIRRGDIMRGKHLKRYTPNDFYFEIARAIREIRTDADIHAWSDSTEPHSFTRYQELGIHMHLGGDVLEAMSHFSAANLFVMGISSFSFVPALLNPRCVLYQSSIGVGGIWVDRIQQWINAGEEGYWGKIEACCDRCP